jgi:hypothetical protein
MFYNDLLSATRVFFGIDDGVVRFISIAGHGDFRAALISGLNYLSRLRTVTSCHVAPIYYVANAVRILRPAVAQPPAICHDSLSLRMI